MKRKIFSLLCATSFCVSLFSPTYAWNLKGKIEERESESSSEVEDEPIHYEDDYVKFDYYDSDGISIEKRVGAGLAKYTFSDIQELAASGTTVNVEFEINSNSTISMDDYMKTFLSRYDNFQLIESDSPMCSYTHNDLNYVSSLEEVHDDYYLVTTYSTDSDSFALSDYFDETLSSFIIKDIFDSAIPDGRSEKSSICDWFYTPDDWIIEDVEAALDICKQYRTLKLTHDEAAEKISELDNLLASTNASSVIYVAYAYFQRDKADISTAISALETFLNRQFDVGQVE